MKRTEDLPETHSHRRTRAERWKNAAFVAADVTLVLVVAAGARWWWINRTPTRTIPTVAMPAENGYERLTQATKLLVDENAVGHALQRPGIAVQPGDHIYTLEEKEQLVAQNAPALAAARTALPQTFQARPLHSFDDLLPELAHFRSFARLFMLEGLVHEQHGEWRQAADSYVDAIELGVKIPRGGILIQDLVGIACQAIGLRPLVPVVDHLTPAEAAEVLARLRAIDAQRTPFSATLETEKRWSEASFISLFRQYSLSRVLVKLRSSSGDSNQGAPSLVERGLIVATAFTTSKEEALANYERYMDEAIAQANLPFDRSRPTPQEPADPINRIILPVFSQARFKDVDIRAHMALLEGKLCVKTQSESGTSYPAQPIGLPVDPFAMNGTNTLHYSRISPTAFRLYSVGPDGRDDGGTPIAKRNNNGEIRRWTDIQDNGDIVLGVDLY